MNETATVKRGLCEVLRLGGTCSRPADWRYPAMGGGYMRLCNDHGVPHAKYSERWEDGSGWQAVPVEDSPR